MTATVTNPPQSATAGAAKPGKALHITLWVFQVLLAAMFFMSGGSKVGGAAQMIGLFETIGIGQWFRYLTGILEVLAAVLLLVPRAAGLGAALLVPVMAGAVVTHVLVLHNSPAVPAVLLLLAGFVAWGRRDHLVALLRGRG